MTTDSIASMPPEFVRLLTERFWRYTKRTGCCWLWSGPLTDGYGLFAFTFEGVKYQFRAHKAAWLLHRGDVPPDMCVLHDCQAYNGLGDMRACTNPDHLKLGTRGDNSRDWRIKGPSPIPRLTTTEARRIRPRPVSDWERRMRAAEQRVLAAA